MLTALKKFFDEALSENMTPAEARHVEAAVASLLHESLRVDLEHNEQERDAARSALAHLFGLSDADAERLLTEGREQASALTSYYAPVATIKQDFPLERRVALIEHLWRIVYADGELHRDEEHYVRKIAHLLYVPNTQVMLARSRARGGK
ncbi:MAG: TerB family tellurite resistance protein [Pseudomonadota bacterium]